MPPHIDPHPQRSILVTGAAGFIGSHLVQALLDAGHRVIWLDNFDPLYPREFKFETLARLSDRDSRFLFVEGDCTDQALLDRLFAEHSPVGLFHLAAKAGVRPSIVAPAAYCRSNVLATAMMLDAAHRAGCERVVIASSSSVYGNCKSAPFHEAQDVNTPISPYAATKRACELLAFTHHHLTRQPVACLRFFTVYGPRQRPDLAIAAFLDKVSKGQRIEVYGDGSSSRDYTYVTDIVAGVMSAYQRIDRFGYRVWNLGNSAPVTLTEMIAAVEAAVGVKAIVTHKPMQPGDVDQTWADLSRSREELDYRPQVGFVQGVAAQWAAMHRI